MKSNFGKLNIKYETFNVSGLVKPIEAIDLIRLFRIQIHKIEIIDLDHKNLFFENIFFYSFQLKNQQNEFTSICCDDFLVESRCVWSWSEYCRAIKRADCSVWREAAIKLWKV